MTCTNATGLIAGASQIYTVHVTVASSVAAGAHLLNGAAVATSGTTDPNPANNTSSPLVDTLVSTNADLTSARPTRPTRSPRRQLQLP